MRERNFQKVTRRAPIVGLGVALFAVLLLLAALAPHVFARPPQDSTTNSSHPDFSGFWEVLPTWRQGVQSAKLTSASIARDKKLNAQRAAGKVVVYASRWCNFLGVPFIMEQSPPTNIVQTPEEIGEYSEQNSAPRYIYLDGRPHPSANSFTPTTNGHSVGHWEGDELIVDTTNFSAKGHPEIPGGGDRGPTSHLVERYKLSKDGRQLVITYTWDDPKVFLEPHTYSVTYRKLPPNTFAYEDICDASDAAPYVNSGGVSDAPDKEE